MEQSAGSYGWFTQDPKCPRGFQNPPDVRGPLEVRTILCARIMRREFGSPKARNAREAPKSETISRGLWGPLEVRTTLCTRIKCQHPLKSDEIQMSPMSSQCPQQRPMPASAFNIRIPSPNSVQLERPCVLGHVSGSPWTP